MLSLDGDAVNLRQMPQCIGGGPGFRRDLDGQTINSEVWGLSRMVRMATSSSSLDSCILCVFK